MLVCGVGGGGVSLCVGEGELSNTTIQISWSKRYCHLKFFFKILNVVCTNVNFNDVHTNVDFDDVCTNILFWALGRTNVNPNVG
jgi:hypothetical protein